MTLIITAGCPDFIVQVSDRRFTLKNTATPLTDEGNKELVIRGFDADFAVSFTGLGSIEGKPVGDCLVDWFGEYTDPAATFDEYVECIRATAEKIYSGFAKNQLELIPLTFVVAGFKHGHKRPTIVTVTNCQTADYRSADPTVSFASHQGLSGKFPYYAAGYLPALAQDSKTKTKNLIRASRSYPQVADLLVQEIRSAAHHRKHGKYIGTECTSICIFRNGEAESVYHATHSDAVTYAPNLMDVVKNKSGGAGRMSFRGMSMVGSVGGDFTAGPSRGGLRIKDRRALFAQTKP